MKIAIVLLIVAIAIMGSNALRMRPVNPIKALDVSDSPYNGSIALGTLVPNKWNQTTFTLSSNLTNIPLTSIWIFFIETETGKLIPSSSFQRASITLTTSNENLSVYNALTSSLAVPRTFSATSPMVIPSGTLSLKLSYALNVGVAAVNASVSWIFTPGGTASTNPMEHANVFLPSWKGAGETSGDVTATIPYDAVISWGVGNVLVGGQSVTLMNNATGAVICTSTITATGDFTPCTGLSVSVPKGTKVTVVVKSNSTGIANNGGMDIYLVKVIPTTTAATTSATHTTAAATTASATHATAATAATAASATHATAATAASATHAASATTGNANSAGHATSGNANSNGGNSAGHSGSGNSGGNSGGHSGSGGNSGGNSGGHSGSGSGSGSGGGNSGSGNGDSSGNGNSASGANNGVTMGYSSGSSGSSGSSSGTGGFFAESEKSIFQMKENKKEVKATKSIKNSKEVTLNDLKRKAMNINDDVEDLEGTDEHFRVFEEKSSQKFL